VLLEKKDKSEVLTLSFLVCHLQKMKAGGISAMQAHCQREMENTSNPDIDFSKTHLNYDLQNMEPINYGQKWHQIINQNLKTDRAIRKDAVRLCSVIVSSDREFFKTLSPGRQKQFFEDSYNFLKDLYGEKNIISATVHLDETTPHLHFQFVPLKNGKLCAKQIINRESLRELQDEIYNFVGIKYDMERGIKTRSHIPIAEFKAQTAQKQQELQAMIQKSIETLKKIQSQPPIEVPYREVKHALRPSTYEVDLKDLEKLKSSYAALHAGIDAVLGNNKYLNRYVREFDTDLLKENKSLQTQISELKADKGQLEQLVDYFEKQYEEYKEKYLATLPEPDRVRIRYELER